ncbi:ABC transporter permease [candidate division KSB1 bacterium]|nr:ABC transporter permease [candidate division KSB1 bacterium]
MLYHISQGIKGLLKAKFSTVFAIIIITLSLLVIALFLLFIVNTQRLVESIHERMELEVFIDNSVDSLAVNNIRMEIDRIAGLKEVRYISKEEAAEYFVSQFDENIFDILDHNPLPASFRMKLEKDFRTSDKSNLIINQLKQINGIDDVIFRQDLLIILEKYMRIAFVFVLIVGGILAFGSIYLVSNTIKLIIFSRSEIINIMKLVGATKNFIRKPFIVEGIIQGLLGAALAILILIVALKIISIEIPNLLVMHTEIYWNILALGIIFGFLGSIFAMNKFIKY